MNCKKMPSWPPFSTLAPSLTNENSWKSKSKNVMTKSRLMAIIVKWVTLWSPLEVSTICEQEWIIETTFKFFKTGLTSLIWNLEFSISREKIEWRDFRVLFWFYNLWQIEKYNPSQLQQKLSFFKSMIDWTLIWILTQYLFLYFISLYFF
jgi:hypothetical protein